ncbi:Crp/Fnr family transcriptional regulator [Lutibaculum baratangense]|uniref:cAMP-binding protein n=1 Tax=Lutibaculum baratangense AMV1 TaxID=631454 RepID=V4RP16_9HYPH|nr:Crp/Fnr family transcriptional regulator [Lutibaculum baratangense]ESR27004.1 cAMP-binding protein [Lutibaculum baratangense AMV1]
MLDVTMLRPGQEALLHVPSGGAFGRNTVLLRLPADVRAVLHELGRLRRVEKGTAICAAGFRPQAVHFIESGAVSSSAGCPDGGAAEVALTGYDGAVGLGSAVLDGASSVTATAQTECEILTVDAKTLRSLSLRRPAVLGILHAELSREVEQLVRLSVCHCRHRLVQRMAGWILAMDHYLEGAVVRATHAELSHLLSVRRATVTETLHMLEGEGAIRSRRGWLAVRDEEKLRAISCGCRHVPQRLES